MGSESQELDSESTVSSYLRRCVQVPWLPWAMGGSDHLEAERQYTLGQRDSLANDIRDNGMYSSLNQVQDRLSGNGCVFVPHEWMLRAPGSGLEESSVP